MAKRAPGDRLVVVKSEDHSAPLTISPDIEKCDVIPGADIDRFGPTRKVRRADIEDKSKTGPPQWKPKNFAEPRKSKETRKGGSQRLKRKD